MLASFISAVHFLIILFILIAPFTSNEFLLMLHAISAPGLLVHWALNQDVCALTLLESYVRGVATSETFVDQLVGSFYRLPKDFDLGNVMTAATFLLWLVSLYKVVEHGILEKFIQGFKNLSKGVGAAETRSTDSASPEA